MIAEYSTQYILHKNSSLEFKDFTLKYLGTREVPVPKLHQKTLLVKEFEISYTGNTKQLSWGSGFGLLIPLHFEVAGIKFSLKPWCIPSVDDAITVEKL